MKKIKSPLPLYLTNLSSSSSFARHHSGTLAPILFQKSHLARLPPSHESASTTSKLFTNPGCTNCVITCGTPPKLVSTTAVPPVSFIFNCDLPSTVQTGQSLTGEDVEGESAPLATDAAMEGSPVVMKLPQMAMNAIAKSGDWLGVGGPK